MSEQSRHLVCPRCDAINRVPVGRPADAARCGHCHERLFTGAPFAATADGFDRQVQRNDVPVVVDFWAEWCGPCKAMAPAFERLASELEPEVRFLKVDVDAEQALAARYRIRSIPTLMLFRRGEIVAQTAGAMDGGSLRAWIQRHVDGSRPPGEL